jgi:hypothetical protein
VVVDTDSRTPRIVEMTIRAGSADGMSAITMPSIDLAGVVRALSAGVLAAEPVAAPTADSASDPAPPAVVVEDSHSADAPREPAARSRRGDRPYRQMPPADDLRAVFERVGTVTAMAAHYGVPRHTAQGWMSRLRKMSG